MAEALELFLKIGLDKRTAENTIANNKVTTNLIAVINEASVTDGCERSMGNLLYTVATKFPANALVLDMPAYEARKREYVSKGHKHFCFMTLNGSEVIDVCAKGNLSRFIHHSCKPNCRTEKGEELTCDYNYVRVFGAAAKNCVCGSSRCRGVIGGDPLNDKTIILGDSDDELPEPIAFDENNSNKLDNRISGIQTVKSTSKNNDFEIDHFHVTADLENVQNGESPDSLLVTYEKDDDPAIPFGPTDREVSFERSSSESKVKDLLSLDTSKVNDMKGKITSRDASEVSIERSSSEMNDVKSEITSRDALDNGLAEKDMKDSKKKPKSHKKLKECTIGKPKSHSKLPSLSSTVLKGKFKSMQPQIDKKPLVEPQKPKRLVVDNLTGHFEAGIQVSMNASVVDLKLALEDIFNFLPNNNNTCIVSWSEMKFSLKAF